MPRYVALLGSINVGGNRLSMAALKTALEGEGFDDVATVGASGNALFDHANADSASLARQIEAIVKDRFGIASFAAIHTCDEIERAISDNPFAKDGEAKYVHTLFLEERLASETVEHFAAGFVGPERIAAGGRHLFVDYAAGVARSRIDPALKKARLVKGRVTARNIRSLVRILEKMDS